MHIYLFFDLVIDMQLDLHAQVIFVVNSNLHDHFLVLKLLAVVKKELIFNIAWCLRFQNVPV